MNIINQNQMKNKLIGTRHLYQKDDDSLIEIEILEFSSDGEYVLIGYIDRTPRVHFYVMYTFEFIGSEWIHEKDLEPRLLTMLSEPKTKNISY